MLTGMHWHHNVQTFIGSAHNIKTEKTNGKILLRANKPMIIMREINRKEWYITKEHIIYTILMIMAISLYCSESVRLTVECIVGI
jgi:hypothetical protein